MQDIILRNTEAITEILTDNQYAVGITLDGFRLWDKSFRQKQAEIVKKEQQLSKDIEYLLNSVESSFLFVTLNNDDYIKHYIITKSKQYKETQSSRNDFIAEIIYYADDLSLEILSGIYREERKGKVEIYGKTYQVEKTIKNEDANLFVDMIMPEAVLIKKHGGLSQYINNKTLEIINLLMYSSRTHRYEIVHATYDKIEKECYMDICIFRGFVKEHGNPGVKFKTRKNDNGQYRHSFEEMNTESILYAYGYNVSSTNGLTEIQRHELLAEIVDLKILNKSQIISFLDFFIDTHNTEKYYIARLKWANDRKYVINYRSNPERFLIMN